MVLDPLELELQMAVNYHAGAEHKTEVLSQDQLSSDP